LLKHLHQKGRKTVDWEWWRHHTTAQGPAPARAGPANMGVVIHHRVGVIRQEQTGLLKGVNTFGHRHKEALHSWRTGGYL